MSKPWSQPPGVVSAVRINSLELIVSITARRNPALSTQIYWISRLSGWRVVSSHRPFQGFNNFQSEWNIISWEHVDAFFCRLLKFYLNRTNDSYHYITLIIICIIIYFVFVVVLYIKKLKIYQLFSVILILENNFKVIK